MDHYSFWQETIPSNRTKATQELQNAKILTNKLREFLDQPEKIETDSKSFNGVVRKITKMFDNTLSIMRSSSPNTTTFDPTNEDQKSKVFNEGIVPITPVKTLKTKRGCYKRRKNSFTMTKVTSTFINDGYAWRKYGQKVILNSKYQRNYYRCSYKKEQGCQATKHVQRTNSEPSKYKTTYNGLHSCNNLQKGSQLIIVEPSNPEDKSMLISFETNTLMENGKPSSWFPSMKHTPNEAFPSLGSLKREQDFSSDTPGVSIVGPSQVSQEPMSIMSSALDCEDTAWSSVLSSTFSAHRNEIDAILDFSYFEGVLID